MYTSQIIIPQQPHDPTDLHSSFCSQIPRIKDTFSGSYLGSGDFWYGRESDLGFHNPSMNYVLGSKPHQFYGLVFLMSKMKNTFLLGSL